MEGVPVSPKSLKALLLSVLALLQVPLGLYALARGCWMAGRACLRLSRPEAMEHFRY